MTTPKAQNYRHFGIDLGPPEIKLIHLWHAVLLSGTTDLGYPRDPCGCVQLNSRLGLIERIHIIHYAGLDNLATWEAGTVTEEGRATISAEVRGNCVACDQSLVRVLLSRTAS